MGSNSAVMDAANSTRGPVVLTPLVLLAVVAFALRWLNVTALAGTPLYGDAHGDGEAYLKLAAQIREGGLGGLFRAGEVYYQAPLYPHVVALFQSLFGEGLGSLRIFQALLGAVGVFWMGLGSARLFGSRAGLGAAALLALFGPSIWLDGLVQKCALSSVLVCALVALWSYRSRRSLVLLGVTVGLLMLTRGEARLLACVFGGAVVLRGDVGTRMRELTPYLVGLALVLVPVFVRNGVLGGDWVLTTSQAGTNFYIGNGDGATGTYTPLVPGRGDARYEKDDARRLAEKAAGRDLTPSEVSAYWSGRALEEMGADPSAALKRLGVKALLAVHHVEVADTDDFGHAQRSSWILRGSIPFTVIFVLGMLGLGLATEEERRQARIFIALGAAQLAALVLFYVFARYRLPLSLSLMPLAGLGVASLGRLRVAWKRPVALAAAAGVLTLVPVYSAETGLAAAWVNEGRALVEAGDYAAAEAAAQEALVLSPAFFDAHRLLALSHLKRGEGDRALAPLERAHELAPSDWQVRAWLGIAVGEAGDMPRAFELLRGAALERPEAMPIVSNAVALAVALGRPSAAVELLRSRLEAFPEEPDVPFRLQLAWILSTSRDDGLRDGALALEVLQPLATSAAATDVRAAALAETGQVEAAHQLTTNPEHRAAYAQGNPWRE